MNSTKRMLPYVRQYVIVAVYDIMDRDSIKYEKTDSSTIVAEMSVYGNKSVFSISVDEQMSGTELTVPWCNRVKVYPFKECSVP